ncbi:MAG: hypothetical protein KBS64_07440 [Treponema sp.]|nr:hypothetical protein [Candidatus Treponema equi]
MDNDNKVTAPKKPRTTKAQQKAKESILAAAEDIIVAKTNEVDPVPADSGYTQNDVHSQVTVLLENELTRISNDDMKKSFDIETEYAQARKNSLHFSWTNMWRRLLLCVAVVLVLTFILMMIVTNNNKKIPVNVKGFDNVKLTEILDNADKLDNQIVEEETKKAEYESQRSDEIQKVEDNYSKEKERIEEVFNQEKRKIEKAYNAEKKKLDTKETKGWLEGRNREKDISKNEKKYEDGLAAAKKKRSDSLAISKSKYRDDLARAKALFRTEIDACERNIKRLSDDRSRFDKDKVKFEAEYDGMLKDRDIQHKRELDELRFSYEQKLMQQKQQYEDRLELARKKYDETVAADLEREKKHVEDTVETYDPVPLKDPRAKKLVKSVGNGIAYNVGTENRISYLPKEGASDMFKKSLDVQKTYYDDISYLASTYEQFPHKENRAVVTYAKTLKSLASKAGNEIYASSVNEVNRLLDEKNKLEFEKNTAVAQKTKLQNEYDNFIEALCLETIGDKPVSALVTTGSGLGYNVYVCKSKLSVFTSEAHKGYVFPCIIYRDSRKVAVANIERTKDGAFYLVNIGLNGSGMVRAGDRVVLEEPYLP